MAGSLWMWRTHEPNNVELSYSSFKNVQARGQLGRAQGRKSSATAAPLAANSRSTVASSVPLSLPRLDLPGPPPQRSSLSHARLQHKTTAGRPGPGPRGHGPGPDSPDGAPQASPRPGTGLPLFERCLTTATSPRLQEGLLSLVAMPGVGLADGWRSTSYGAPPTCGRDAAPACARRLPPCSAAAPACHHLPLPPTLCSSAPLATLSSSAAPALPPPASPQAAPTACSATPSATATAPPPPSLRRWCPGATYRSRAICPSPALRCGACVLALDRRRRRCPPPRRAAQHPPPRFCLAPPCPQCV